MWTDSARLVTPNRVHRRSDEFAFGHHAKYIKYICRVMSKDKHVYLY